MSKKKIVALATTMVLIISLIPIVVISKYNVPYYQVYTWVKKVKENGYESLKLQKKGPKSKYLVEPQTNEELLQLEIERLRREKERLELEVEVLKKKHRLQKRADIRK